MKEVFPRAHAIRPLILVALAVVAALLPILLPAHLWADHSVFLLLTVMVLCAAIVGGIWAALAMTAAGALVAAYALPPGDSLAVERFSDQLVLELFVLTGALVGAAIERTRRELTRLRDQASDLRRRSDDARAEAQQSEACLRRLWESNLLGIMRSTSEGGVVDANTRMLGMLGYTEEDLRAGRVRWNEMTPPEHTHLDAHGIAEALARGACTPYEKVYVGKDGRRVPILIGYAPLEGSRSEFVAFVLDLTERQALLESERAARAEAERLSRAKDEFVALLSHELRTPLNAIQGWTDLLRQAPRVAPEKLAHGLDVLARNTRLLTQLIGDLLEVSRIDAGKLHLDRAEVALGPVIEATLEGLRAPAEQKRVTLDVHLAARDLVVSGDAGRLVQVVSNLVSNAIKFTPRGGCVEVALERAGSEARVTVADTGEGIAPELLPHIFERFRQADASAARRHGGLGLGLSIVRHLVEMHGGRVRAESAGLGCGARFTVDLPLIEAAAASAPMLEAPSGDGAVLAGAVVLVVEDEPDALELTLRVLEERGASVLSAASGPEALALLTEARPEVLVSDIGLPGMDGYELVRRVREGGLAIPALALTAFARPEDRERAFAAGFQEHVPKPVEPSALVTAVLRLRAAA